MFKHVKQTPPVFELVMLRDLKDGELFTFHEGEKQTVYMKLQRPDFGKYEDPKTYIISLTGGKVVGMDNQQVFPVIATMEWHHKPLRTA